MEKSRKNNLQPIVFQLRHIACIFCINNFLVGIPMTYEEYFDLVKQELKTYLDVYKLSDGEFEVSLIEEAIIKERYSMCLEAIEQGEMTVEQMEYGSVGSVAYCLSMLYE